MIQLVRRAKFIAAQGMPEWIRGPTTRKWKFFMACSVWFIGMFFEFHPLWFALVLFIDCNFSFNVYKSTNNNFNTEWKRFNENANRFVCTTDSVSVWLEIRRKPLFLPAPRHQPHLTKPIAIVNQCFKQKQ